MFDITTLAATETSTLQLKGANDEPLYSDNKPVTVTIYGPGSARFAEADADRTNRQLERSRRKNKASVSAEDLRVDQIDFLSKVTLGFDNLSYPPANGATGPELARAIYSDRSIGFIADQVQAHLGDWANFTKG
jgi:hypothetical protein